jgi:hypothetical protein
LVPPLLLGSGSPLGFHPQWLYPGLSSRAAEEGKIAGLVLPSTHRKLLMFQVPVPSVGCRKPHQ